MSDMPLVCSQQIAGFTAHENTHATARLINIEYRKEMND